MNKIKFIVFADPKTPCKVAGDNFIQQILKKDYGNDGNSNAIGIRFSESASITSYNELFDIFLFNDIGQPPNETSLFFLKFAKEFFKGRENFSFKIILHDGSGWSFEKYYTDSGELNDDYQEFKEAIDWLKSLPREMAKHVPDGIYDKELKVIANAIIKSENEYTDALKNLNAVFIDPEEETKTDNVFDAIYNQKDEETIETSVKNRDKHLKGKSKN